MALCDNFALLPVCIFPERNRSSFSFTINADVKYTRGFVLPLTCPSEWRKRTRKISRSFIDIFVQLIIVDMNVRAGEGGGHALKP